MVFFDFLSVGIISPIFPDLVRHFEGGDFARGTKMLGYFLLAWATMQLIFSPILGAWSDRFGRRPVILISCFGLSVDYILMALAPSLGWLFVGRVISGITTSNVATAFAYVTDTTTPDRRERCRDVRRDRKSTRLNSSHTVISYAVFCLKKKKKKKTKY